VRPARRRVSEAETQAANRQEWDGYADEYQAAHGVFLRDIGFLWCPEGVEEDSARVLGDTAGRDVLEIGCGAAQCARWLTVEGARAIGLDLSERQLWHAHRVDDTTGVRVPVVAGTATSLPFRDGCFDVVFSAFGALQFVLDAGRAVQEVSRVLRPGGTFAFSISHPIRWCFPDDPTSAGLTVTSSYWDRTPYVEEDDDGRPTYVEHHRTLGDWVGLLSGAGFRLDFLLEPEWPEGNDRVWGGWGPERGRLIPGTAILRAVLD
jgi:SAM-dependent methyltransferase